MWTHHSVGDDTARSPFVRGEEPLRVARDHDECLVVMETREVVHEYPELSPVGEDLSVATVRHQLMGEL